MAPWTDGLSLLSRAMSVDNDLAVILITGHGDIAMAVNAMREVRRAIAPLTDAEIDAIGEFGTPGASFTIGCTRCARVEHCGCQMHPRGRLFYLNGALARAGLFDAGPAKALCCPLTIKNMIG